jgi:NAD(P)-dependent dehydrogenase (short-subunit alcohol dehydrogenase family)
MSLNFENRVAIVTGAGKGLGRAYAIWLAERGARIVVNNRIHPDTPSSAEAVVREIRDAGGTAVADHSAVDDEAGGEAMAQTALKAFGRLDILINNAGIVDDALFTDLSLDRMRRIMDINFWGSLYPTRAAFPIMLEQGYGRIVLSCSQAGLYGQKEGSLYGASKSALIGFGRTLGREVPEGVDLRINLITPAAYTPMSARSVDTKWSDYMSPFKVCPAVGWLASDKCQESGIILNAGAGRVRRARIVEGPVVDIVGDDISNCFPALDDLSNPVEAGSSFESGMILMPELFATDPEMIEKA